MTKTLRLTIDILMVILLPMLMAYSLIGEAFHEIIGTAMLALLIAHHILNRRFYSTVFKGRYNAGRVYRTALDTILLIALLLQPVSGILMSKHLYTFLPTPPLSALMRSIHMLCAYWSFILMGLHTGAHLGPLVYGLKQKKGWLIAVCTFAGAISIYGVYAFITRGFPGYLSGTTKFAFFDFSEPRVFFFLDYLAVLVLYETAGIMIISLFNRIGKSKSY